MFIKLKIKDKPLAESKTKYKLILVKGHIRIKLLVI